MVELADYEKGVLGREALVGVGLFRILPLALVLLVVGVGVFPVTRVSNGQGGWPDLISY